MVRDLNRDAKLDIVAVVYRVFPSDPTDGIAVLIGRDDGTFDPPVFYAIPATEDVTCADLNLDGYADVAVTTLQPAQALGVLLGNGDGTLWAPAFLPLSSGAGSVAADDLNRDGKPDLVLDIAYALVTLVGHGDGQFDPPRLHFNDSAAGDMEIGDVDGDAIPDVVTLGVRVWRGLGDGGLQFARQYQIAEGFYLFDVVQADLRNLGRLDIVASAAHAITVLLTATTGVSRTASRRSLAAPLTA